MAANRAKTFFIDGVEHRKCHGCKDTDIIYRPGHSRLCKNCNLVLARNWRKQERKVRSWAGYLKRDLARIFNSTASCDYYANGFDSETGKNKYPQGSLMWYFFLEGWNEKTRRAIWDFMPLREDEAANPAGMSGQAATRLKNSAKRHTGTARIYEDDEFYADSE